MLGIGILKGLAVTFKHFAETYIDDLKYFPRRYSEDALSERQSVRGKGLFTIQYPKQDREVAEQFRYLPFLIYDETGETPMDGIRCTACGICARVCPTQCIWIVRAKDENGKPMTRPAEFNIDIDVCMNCGFCAEFCPFNSIAMDHDRKLADYERWDAHVYDLKKLLRPASFFQQIRPTEYAEQQQAADEKKKK